jgi:hypothetical protein
MGIKNVAMVIWTPVKALTTAAPSKDQHCSYGYVGDKRKKRNTLCALYPNLAKIISGNVCE